MREADRAAFRLIAHRGASSAAPENTRAAFRLAAAHGAREIETDVRLTRDDQVVLFHDRTLRPKCNRAGAAEDLTLTQLEALDIGSWFDRTGAAALNNPALGWDDAPNGPASPEYVLGFEAYLDEFGSRFHHHIELKGASPGLPRAVLAALRARGGRLPCTFTSFDLNQLERLRALAPDAPAGWLFPRKGDPTPSPAAAVEECRRLGLQQCNPGITVLTSEHVQAAHAAGLTVRTFSLRTPLDLRRAVALGAEGATVNWYRSARRQLDHWRRTRAAPPMTKPVAQA